MEKCCINGCDSHKNIGDKNIGYFQFPLHDQILMKKWLAQINLPNWKPGAHHRICSMHFCTKDVDIHPNRRHPFLNPTSVPTIFPKKFSASASTNQKEETTISTESQIPQMLQVVKVNGNGGCDMSVLQSMPVFLIPVQSNVQNARHISTQCAAQLPMQKQSSTEKFVPTIIQDSQELEESPNNVAGQTEESSRGLVQQRPFVQPRLRKILPKPDFLIVPNINDSPGVLNTLQSISPPKSDICFVPNVANPTPNGSAITRPLRYPGNMRAVLRISINKHRNDDGPYNEPIDISSDEADKIRSTDRADSSSKEITIENTSTNKAVTFRLDPESGEIVVTTQRMDDSSRDEEDEETTRTERKVDYACEQPSAAKLRQLYTKGQLECNALRKRLRLLRQQHREEQEEIKKLQENLTQIGVKVQKTCRDDISESRSTKRTEAEKNVRSSNGDDDYEKLLYEVKKMKRDIRITRTDLSMITNDELEAPQSTPKLTGNNIISGLLDDKNYPPKKARSNDRKILGVINDRYKYTSRTINGSSIDMNPDSESDVVVYKEEFLDTEFLFE